MTSRVEILAYYERAREDTLHCREQALAKRDLAYLADCDRTWPRSTPTD